MVATMDIQKILKDAGVSRWLLSRGEKKALHSFLRRGESVEACVKGFYRGGRGILVATSHRLILIDKNITSIYTRVIGYESISDVRYFKRFFDASVFVTINGKNTLFKSSSPTNLRRLSAYLRGKILMSQESTEDEQDVVPMFSVPEFEDSKRILTPRHRHGKFLISLR